MAVELNLSRLIAPSLGAGDPSEGDDFVDVGFLVRTGVKEASFKRPVLNETTLKERRTYLVSF